MPKRLDKVPNQIVSHQKRLVQVAEAIGREFDRLPVDILAICRSFGARVEQDGRIKEHGAFLTFKEGQLDKPLIVVRPGNASSGYARLCIAHELAHLILIRDFSIVPRGESQYWQYETICDEFAARLLVPKSYINELMLTRPSTGSALLMRSIDIEREALITWIHGARRLADIKSRTCFFRIQQVSDKLFKVMGSTLSNHRGRTAEIPRSAKVFELFCSMLRTAERDGVAKATRIEKVEFEQGVAFLNDYNELFAICRKRSSVGREILLVATGEKSLRDLDYRKCGLI